jgi:hypothetical protein
MAMSPAGLGPENNCAGEDQQLLQTTGPASHQRGRPTSANQQVSDSGKNLVMCPRWGLTPRQTLRLTVGPNIILMWTLTFWELRSAGSQY